MKNERITAEEARRLSGPSIESLLGEAYELIRDAASRGKSFVRLITPDWTKGGYNTTEAWKQAKTALEADGFTVNYHYEERQFVDMYTEVKW
jgi:pyruvate/2-oxoacid:ferredoxin oxidoreductase beta subunit